VIKLLTSKNKICAPRKNKNKKIKFAAARQIKSKAQLQIVVVGQVV
jgi:hypothetical protein